MSCLGCLCGYIIPDQTDNLPYKAYFVPDEDINADIELFVAQLTALLKVRELREQEVSLHEQSGMAYPVDEATQDALYGAISGMIYRSGREIYECENCGRIWVQKHAEYGKDLFACYLPESDERGVLRSQHQGKQEE